MSNENPTVQELADVSGGAIATEDSGKY